MRTPYNKIVFTPEQHDFMRSNFQKMTNKELADHFGLKLTRVRTELYSLGLLKLELEYWTEEQVQFLKDNYKNIGDTELAELFNDRWTKKKGWTKKHIEKKRRYLKLKRTDIQKNKIFLRNKELGAYANCATNMWKTRGVKPEGTIVIWRVANRQLPFIKINGKYIHLNVHVWESNFGEVPEGFNVVRKDGNPLNNSIENLQLLSNSELAIHNSKLRMSYPEELREINKLINKLNKKVKSWQETK